MKLKYIATAHRDFCPAGAVLEKMQYPSIVCLEEEEVILTLLEDIVTAFWWLQGGQR